MPVLSGRVGTFTDSVIRRMTRINNQYDSINLSQGFPDFDPPQQLLDALAKTAYNGPHQYAVTFGAQNFREALAKKTSPALHHEVDPNTEVCVTCGGTEAMMAAMMTICNPGDKVMIFSPFYENYGADAILSGAEPIYIPLVPPTYEFDISLIEKGFAEGAKALILCNPSNPCGKVFRRDELEAIAKLAIQYDAFVVTDEVYEHIIYAPAEHICMASLPGMFEHTITCNSLSKTYSITGWRLGYLIGPAEVIEGARKVHDFLTVGAAAPLQEAAVAGLQLPENYYKELQALYTAKRDHFLAGLDRPRVLRVDDQRDRRSCRAGFQLLPGAGEPSHPHALCPRHRRAGRSHPPAGKAGRPAEIKVGSPSPSLLTQCHLTQRERQERNG